MPEDPYAQPRTCPKCGHYGPVAITWRVTGQACPEYGHLGMDEHLDLSCRRCGWTETDPVLDLKP